jgi:fatty acid desaturase (delta-4 desaturase)
MPPAPDTQQTEVPVVAKTVEAIKLDDEVVQVDDKVYKTDGLAKIHPGGEVFVKAFSGRDATEAFLSYHRRSFPHSKYENELVSKTLTTRGKDDDADFLELCRIVDQVLPRHKAFATTSYYLKVAFIMTGALGIEAYIHYTGQYVWWLTAPLGFFFALIGLNIQHDANHGSISKNWVINRVLGVGQNWIGGSAIDWIHQHVVQHHIETNDVHDDPDIAGSDIIRLNPIKPLMKHQAVQYIYTFMLIAIFGYIMMYSSLEHQIKGITYTPISGKLSNHRKFEIFMSGLFIFRWFLLPLIQVPSIYTLLSIFPMFAVGGYYLAFYFILSHNFEGAYMFDKTAPNHEKSFLYRQVASSSNVGGSWLCFLNGGLNYQIEHHLFPRIQHTHYPSIAPVVRAYCEKKGIPYRHFPTVWENFVSTARHLHNMGSKEDAVPIEQQ